VRHDRQDDQRNDTTQLRSDDDRVDRPLVARPPQKSPAPHQAAQAARTPPSRFRIEHYNEPVETI
jgi:hypothetical protein